MEEEWARALGRSVDPVEESTLENPSFRADHDEIPQPAIIGQRNIVPREYQKIDNARIPRVAIRDLPRLIGKGSFNCAVDVLDRA